MAKFDTDDLILFGVKAGVVGSIVFVICAKGASKQKISHDEYKEKYHKCNVISVYDGEINVDANQDTNKLCRELSYKVAQQDDEELVIYVYSQDKNERETYTKYIESKIFISDDGRVLFNKDDISDQDYYSYVADLQKDQNSNGQRVRAKNGREN